MEVSMPILGTDNTSPIKHNILYLLKSNIILDNVSDTEIELTILNCNIDKSKIIINYENNKPIFILIESENDDLCNKIEMINENIDNYEFIEDVVYELNKFINDDMRKMSMHNLVNIINKIKGNTYLKYSNGSCFKNDKSMLSLDASIEMVCDQLIKIHSSNNMYINNKLDNIEEFTVILHINNIGGIDCGVNDVYVSVNIKIHISNMLTVPPIISLSSNKKFKSNLLQAIEKMDLFTVKNNTSLWTVKYCLYSTLQKIYEIINICGCIQNENETYNDILTEHVVQIESLLKINNDTIKQNTLLELFDKDLLKSHSQTKKTYWAKGTGYGTNDDNPNWDINSYIKKIKSEQEDLSINMIKLTKLLSSHNVIIKNSIIPRLTNIVKHYLYNDTIDINVIEQLKQALVTNKLLKLKDIAILIVTYLKDNNLNYTILSDMFSCQMHLLSGDCEGKGNGCNEQLTPFQQQFNKYKFRYANVNIDLSGSQFTSKYISPSPSHITRLQREFQILKKSIIISEDASIFFTVQTDNICKMRFIISGPKNTPYEYGLFIFNMTIPAEFPAKPPICILENTGGIRFNPNLYDSGYVCSSILNTWRGLASESWTPELSTIFQIFMSIQSQIFVEQPYFNEPGYEKSMNTPSGQRCSDEYNEKIMQYTLDHAMINLLDSTAKGKYPEFNDVINEYFTYHRYNIINTLNIWEKKLNPYKILYHQHQKEKFIKICPVKV
jgi:ubiquitin-protein ligase